jgi:predicted CoA-substrate-specific enzyme activase
MNDLFIGIDVGSISTEVVLLDRECNIIGFDIAQSGINGAEAAGRLLKKLLSDKSFSKINKNHLVSTGYGRKLVKEADKVVTEITCHALGSMFFFPETDTVLDIGGQDCKAIRIGEDGIVQDFQMNDRCAAGSGRFVEVMASVLEMDLDTMNELYFRESETVEINATCTVFAESEVISLLNDGIRREAIIKGIFKTIAERSLQLLNIVTPNKNLTLSGGVSKNKALVEEIKTVFRGNVNVPEEPQIIGALGAALMAIKLYR